MSLRRFIPLLILVCFLAGILLVITNKGFFLSIHRRITDQQKKISFTLQIINDWGKTSDEIKNSISRVNNDEEIQWTDCFINLKNKCFVLPEIIYTESETPAVVFKSIIGDMNSEENLKGIRSLLYGDPLLLPQLEGIDIKNKISKEIGSDVLIQHSLQYDINPIYVASIVRYMSPISFEYFSTITDFIPRKTRQYYQYLEGKWINEWWYGKFDQKEKTIFQELSKIKNQTHAKKILMGLGLLYFDSDFSVSLYKPLFPMFYAQKLLKEYSISFISDVISDTKFEELNFLREKNDAFSLGICKKDRYFWCVEDVKDRDASQLLCREMNVFPRACARKERMLEL